MIRSDKGHVAEVEKGGSEEWRKVSRNVVDDFLFLFPLSEGLVLMSVPGPESVLRRMCLFFEDELAG